MSGRELPATAAIGFCVMNDPCGIKKEIKNYSAITMNFVGGDSDPPEGCARKVVAAFSRWHRRVHSDPNGDQNGDRPAGSDG